MVKENGIHSASNHTHLFVLAFTLPRPDPRSFPNPSSPTYAMALPSSSYTHHFPPTHPPSRTWELFWLTFPRQPNFRGRSWIPVATLLFPLLRSATSTLPRRIFFRSSRWNFGRKSSVRRRRWTSASGVLELYCFLRIG